MALSTRVSVLLPDNPSIDKAPHILHMGTRWAPLWVCDIGNFNSTKLHVRELKFLQIIKTAAILMISYKYC